jgi:4'-phosphopantetheinyl transferase EntD
MKSAATIRRNRHVELLFDDLPVVAYDRCFRPEDPLPPLHAEEATAVDSAVPKRVREFAHARSCARAALAELGRPSVAIPMAPDRAPVWPNGITGSITHTSGYCLAAAAKLEHLRSIGIDAEIVGAVDENAGAVILTDRDRRAILNTVDFDLGRTLVFAAKEALYKAQYPITRSWLDFSDVVAVEVQLSERGASSRSGSVQLEPANHGRAVPDIEWPVTARWRCHGRHLTAVVATTAVL